MPTFRSKTDRSKEAGFLFRSELPVKSRRQMLPFFPHAIRIKRSLDQTITADDGLLHYELIADMGSQVFFVSSAWSDEASFRKWVGTATHIAAMKSLGPRVEGGTFDTEILEPQR